MTLTVSSVYRYPIKACAGNPLQVAEVGPRGIQGDREFMVIDAATGGFLTQREVPRLALVRVGRPDPLTPSPSLSGDGEGEPARRAVPPLHLRKELERGDGGEAGLSLAAPGMPALSFPIRSDDARREVVVWADTCLAVDQGDEVAGWLSSFLGHACRLVRMADEFVRRVDPRYATSLNDQVGFADGYPLLLLSEESLADLNGRLDRPLPMNRFRPSIVIRGAEPFVEDRLRTFRIGQILFHVVKPCARCVVTTTDQQTAVVGKEPLPTLARFRQVGHKVIFGQNLTHEGTGIIGVGDEIDVVEFR
jgi:uncharacterized protein YcbX